MQNNTELNKISRKIELNHKDLTTKYNVLVKRTNSIISSLNKMLEYIDTITEKLSVLEFIEDEESIQEFYDPYQDGIPEEYEEQDDDEDDE